MDAQAHPAVRDPAGATRHDDARTVGLGQDELHSGFDEGDDGLRRAASRDAHESEGDHGAADVRPPRRGHQRLDRRHIQHAVASHAQDQTRRTRLACARRTGRRHLDRESQLSA